MTTSRTRSGSSPSARGGEADLGTPPATTGRPPGASRRRRSGTRRGRPPGPPAGEDPSTPTTSASTGFKFRRQPSGTHPPTAWAASQPQPPARAGRKTTHRAAHPASNRERRATRAPRTTTSGPPRSSRPSPGLTRRGSARPSSRRTSRPWSRDPRNWTSGWRLRISCWRSQRRRVTSAIGAKPPGSSRSRSRWRSSSARRRGASSPRTASASAPSRCNDRAPCCRRFGKTAPRSTRSTRARTRYRSIRTPRMRSANG
mmetsp:Transcript_1517/g.6775  ORF Transcript_1517/g.6775 Transcript_1517/m.6775 type:complete len:258 (+) Transcript_1517:308-1081(+)